MLQKENRLSKRKDFAIIKGRGRTASSPVLSLRYAPGDFSGPSRFAFVVSKKVFKKAVDRNRARRRLREVVRLLVKDSKIKPGISAVFYIKKGIENEPFEQLRDAAIFLLKKATIFKA